MRRSIAIAENLNEPRQQIPVDCCSRLPDFDPLAFRTAIQGVLIRNLAVCHVLDVLVMLSMRPPFNSLALILSPKSSCVLGIDLMTMLGQLLAMSHVCGFDLVTGEVVEVNAALAETPGLVNTSPESDGWMAKLKLSVPSEVDALMVSWLL